MLRLVLEEQYERHTIQLEMLARQERLLVHSAADARTAATLTAASRRALGEIARALHYLEHGVYGTCRTCGCDIPIEHLAQRPVLDRCPACSSAAAEGAALPG
ncbi:hypothetical protein OHA72_36650 [Dactylosporangium sp. NBC_01737]|uniref:hypothetical protein n=1 Tax=Dactylosporangium sp. NBC_01737 TaxID=2975959 RepID=UPI002E10533C|nr:hypothetical protein OHA72_36650 [Dactylosporangium sp. NBC_01737]